MVMSALAKALATGQSTLKTDVLSRTTPFQQDYPFPCLLNPEPDAPDAPFAPKPGGSSSQSSGIPLTKAREQQRRQQQPKDFSPYGSSTEADEVDGIATDLHEVVLSSTYKADLQQITGSMGQPLVDYNVLQREWRGGKESLPKHMAASYQSNFITEEVIGSLPKGLSYTEKARLSSSWGPSNAMQRLHEMPKIDRGSRTAAGDRLRHTALKCSVVAFITAGYSGKKFVYEKAKELGVRSIILDGPDSWSQVLVKEGLIEQFIPIDFADAATVFDRCLKALTNIRESAGGLDGVMTFMEFAVPLVARLAEHLGLPGNPPSACDMARNKADTRKMMAAVGLPSPRNTVIKGQEDLEAAVQHVGFPAVIKPIAAAASMGVVRVDNMDEAREKVAKVQRQVKLLHLDETGNISAGDDTEDIDSSATGGADETQSKVPVAGRANLVPYINTDLMIEEYLDGDEVDVDIVLSDSQCTYGAITDNWPTLEPYFNETGSNCPSILPLSTQRDLLDLSVATLQVLGFKLGVFHVELKATSRGPRLIEVNPCMGGGGVRDINRLVWGVDLVEEHIMAACGLPARPLIAKYPLKHLAEYSINAPVTGIVEHTDFLKPWQSLPDIIYARPLVQAGQKVVSVQDGMPTWVCELCVHKPSVREAIAFLKNVEKELQLPIRPLKPHEQ